VALQRRFRGELVKRRLRRTVGRNWQAGPYTSPWLIACLAQLSVLKPPHTSASSCSAQTFVLQLSMLSH